MTIDKDIKKKANDIRTKIYGKEVREGLASGLELMGNTTKETKDRQDNVENQFQQVIDETTGKDVISAPEIIVARGEEQNLNERLNKIDAKGELLDDKTDKIMINVKDYGAKGDGITDDSSSVQLALDIAKQLGAGGVVFPLGEYHLNNIEINGNNMVVDGKDSTIIYNGKDELEGGKDWSSTTFNIYNAEKIEFKNFIMKGQLFKGLSYPNLPHNTVENAHTIQGRGIYGENAKDILVKNIKVETTRNAIQFVESENIKIINCKTDKTSDSFRFRDCDQVTLDGCQSKNARFTLSRLASTNVVGSSGALGTGFLFDGCTGVIKNSTDYYSATDGLRLQGASNMTFEGVISEKARRHGVSMYGEGSYLKLNNCKVIDIGDSSFWTGGDYDDTYKRPAEWLRPRNVFVNPENHITIDNCIIKNQDILEEPVQSEDFYSANCVNNLIDIKSDATAVIKNSLISGFSYRDSVNFYDSNGNITFADNVVERTTLATDADYHTHGRRTLLVRIKKGDEGGGLIKGNKFKNGRVELIGSNITFTDNKVESTIHHAVQVREASNIMIANNHIVNPGGRGFYVVLSDGGFISSNFVFSNKVKTENLLISFVSETGTNFMEQGNHKQGIVE